MTDDFLKNDDQLHIALIPDGNRRYAQKFRKPVWYGHYMGARKIEEFIRWCSDYEQIKTVSIFALSTENLKRPKKELEHLWRIYKTYLFKALKSKDIKQNQIKVNVFGNEDVWREDIKQAARDVMRLTAQYSRKVVNILLSYGSRIEIVNAAKQLLKERVKKSKFANIIFD
ncbi:MAG: polyprenyl diphosphate synthase, partial [Candidatus Aenigmatarchaeota archaeon]